MVDTKRKNLQELLPLETPLSVHIFPSYYCNFKCNFCLHSLDKKILDKRNFKKEFMNMKTFKNAINGIKEFNSKLKTVIFVGHGEPLMHKDIAEMIKYTKDADISERVEIVTNASLLRKELSNKLIEANLDLLRISLQGVTNETYKEISGVNCSPFNIKKNIEYYYNNKKEDQKVHIKIVNIALKDKADEKIYFDIFKPISDETTIEYIIPFINEIDHTTITNDLSKCKLGHDVIESKICSMPFYMMAIEPNGNIIPCCSSEIPIIYGNVNKDSVKDIWNSKKVNNFLCLQLENLNKNKVCSNCVVPKHGLQKGDYLDRSQERLLNIYRSR